MDYLETTRYQQKQLIELKMISFGQTALMGDREKARGEVEDATKD